MSLGDDGEEAEEDICMTSLDAIGDCMLARGFNWEFGLRER